MRENQRHTVPAFFLKCAVLQPKYLNGIISLTFTTIQKRAELQPEEGISFEQLSFTTIQKRAELQPQMALQTTTKF